LIVNRSH